MSFAITLIVFFSTGPILVNEWFVVTVQLTNAEELPIRDIVVSASLTEASDPIISDTTRLVLDFKMPEPVTPMTPTTGKIKTNKLNCFVNSELILYFV